MEKPEVCPGPLYNMMMRTWDADPTHRPTFLELMDELGDLLEEGEKDHYLDLTKMFDASTVGTCNTVENKDYLAMMSPPDFMTQMSASPMEQEDGYLQPRKSEAVVQLDHDDYLLPNGKANQFDSIDKIESTALLQNGNSSNGNGSLIGGAASLAVV